MKVILGRQCVPLVAERQNVAIVVLVDLGCANRLFLRSAWEYIQTPASRLRATRSVQAGIPTQSVGNDQKGDISRQPQNAAPATGRPFALWRQYKYWESAAHFRWSARAIAGRGALPGGR